MTTEQARLIAYEIAYLAIREALEDDRPVAYGKIESDADAIAAVLAAIMADMKAIARPERSAEVSA